jgi:hypothetical protein
MSAMDEWLNDLDFGMSVMTFGLMWLAFVLFKEIVQYLFDRVNPQPPTRCEQCERLISSDCSDRKK